jgi:hypothetical protein
MTRSIRIPAVQLLFSLGFFVAPLFVAAKFCLAC